MGDKVIAPSMKERVAQELTGLHVSHVGLKAENFTTGVFSHTGLSIKTEINSPTNSEGTEFYDAHEEIPWTPDRPARRLSPMNKHKPTGEGNAVQKGWLWAANDNGGTGATADGSAGAASTLSRPTRSCLPEDVADFLQDDNDEVVPLEEKQVSEQQAGSTLRHLFPSKNSMLEIEDRRSSAHLPAKPSTSHNPSNPRRAMPPVTVGSVVATATQPEQPTITEGKQALQGVPKSLSRVVSANNDTNNDKNSNTSGEDEDGEGSVTSTESGTLTESVEGDSSHRFDVESAGGNDEDGKGGKRYAGKEDGVDRSAGSPETGLKKNSLRRVLDNARTHHNKIMGMGRKRGGSEHNINGSSNNNSRSGSPTLDSSTLTSPEDPQTVYTVLPPLAVGDSSPPGRNLDDTPSCRSGSGRCVLRGTKGAATGRETEGPPEVKVHQHGRSNAKKDGWRSMHMVQCLRYHEGSVWTVEFNRHGTRLATGGQDGKVVLWNICSEDGEPDDGADQTGSSDVGGRQDISANALNTGEQKNLLHEELRDRKSGQPNMLGMSADYLQVRYDAVERTESGASSGSGFSDDPSSGSIERRSGDLSGGDRKESFVGLKVFDSDPFRVFIGHKNDIVDLSWSNSDFLCSASIDHTVMLWHPTREGRLGTFRHPNFLTAVHFHPWDDGIILTACFDKRLRLWAVDDGRVVNWVQCQDMITAASFSPDGQLTTAGLTDGRVIFYHTKDLRYYTQIHCKNRHGSNRRGKKVTGLAFIETAQLRHSGQQPGDRSLLPGMAQPRGTGSGGGLTVLEHIHGKLRGGKANSMSAQYSLLCTTNDSRLRVFDLDNFAMTNKFKGLLNDGMQIKGSFSEDGKFVISGSEDGQVYMWNSRHKANVRASVSSASCIGPNMGGVDPTAAVPNAGRVKSRTSSSFSVQCSIRPKIATVAAFFPHTALHAVLENWERCGAGKVEDYGDDGEFPSITSSGTKDKDGFVRARRGWRANRLRRFSAPFAADTFGEASAVIGDKADGMIRLRRRRWSFTGQGQLGAGSSRDEAANDKSWQQPSQKPSIACESAPNTHSSQRRFSLSPVPRRAQNSKYCAPAGRSPGASSTAWRSNESLAQQPTISASSQPVESVEVRLGDGESRSRGRLRGAVGGVRAVITADYNGELKVFLGFGEAPL